MITGLVVPPISADISTARNWVVRILPSERDTFAGALVAADPAAFSGNLPDGREIGTMITAVVAAGAVAALLIGLAAAVVATADRSVERRSLDANLVAAGVPTRVLRLAQLWTVSLPIAITTTLAAVFGAITGDLYRRRSQGSSVSFPWSSAVLAASSGLLGAVIAGSLAVGLANTRLRTADLRPE